MPSRTSKSKEREAAEREKIVLWRRPLQTFTYCSKQLIFNITTAANNLLAQRLLLAIGSIFLLCVYVLLKTDGPHQKYFIPIEKQFFWCLYWVGLGILSSVGLGTGLHTFVLYLGPHIASVTLAAYECNSLNFPEPPYPDEIICPDNVDSNVGVSIFQIMGKVRLEAMMWGAGTALGELPPYFMARAARLSGYDPEDKDDLREFQELQRKKANLSEASLIDKLKIGVEKMVETVGFFGILACASIPNPLFDLAGITCGHFLVPFWTFFGATLLGKAVIKMHIQKLFVIISFNESLIEQALVHMHRLPYIGPKLQEPFREYLAKQKEKLHRRGTADAAGSGMLGWFLEKFLIAMVMYFVVSIINSLAQSYHKRLCKDKKKTRD